MSNPHSLPAAPGRARTVPGAVSLAILLAVILPGCSGGSPAEQGYESAAGNAASVEGDKAESNAEVSPDPKAARGTPAND